MKTYIGKYGAMVEFEKLRIQIHKWMKFQETSSILQHKYGIRPAINHHRGFFTITLLKK
jgi:hypothetical protein